jgi:5-methylcytosine-specific restriction endonuclease McrA
MKKQCLVCKKVFDVRRSDSKFCSNSCRCKAYKANNRDKELLRKRKWYYKEKTFNYDRLRDTNKKASLKYKTANKEKIASYNKEYQNRTKQSEINRNLRYFGGNRIIVLERDKYLCKTCGCSDKKQLVVHHIDGSKGKNNLLENLMTLCRKCHINIHRKMKI